MAEYVLLFSQISLFRIAVGNEKIYEGEIYLTTGKNIHQRQKGIQRATLGFSSQVSKIVHILFQYS